MMETNTLLQEAEALRQTILDDRRELHRHAETGFDLKKTLPYVKQQLTDMGLAPE